MTALGRAVLIEWDENLLDINIRIRTIVFVLTIEVFTLWAPLCVAESIIGDLWK